MPRISYPITSLEPPPLHLLTEAEQAYWNQDRTTKADVSSFDSNTLSRVPTLCRLTGWLEVGGTRAQRRLHSC
jgi:hypothetical protein